MSGATVEALDDSRAGWLQGWVIRYQGRLAATLACSGFRRYGDYQIGNHQDASLVSGQHPRSSEKRCSYTLLFVFFAILQCLQQA